MQITISNPEENGETVVRVHQMEEGSKSTRAVVDLIPGDSVDVQVGGAHWIAVTEE